MSTLPSGATRGGQVVSLIGTRTLVLAGVIAAACPGLCVLLWNKVRGPRALRGAYRLGLIAAAQAAALVFAGIAVNDYGGFYVSWSELAGVVGVVTGNVPHVALGSRTGAPKPAPKKP